MTNQESPANDTTTKLGRDSVLAVNGLRVDFGGVVAVDSLSFEIERGTTVGLIGPNGAGKSTALKAIGGEVKPTKGQIVFGGTNLAGRPRTSPLVKG